MISLVQICAKVGILWLCLTHQHPRYLQGAEDIVAAVCCPNRCRLPPTTNLPPTSCWCLYRRGVRADRSTSLQAGKRLRAKCLPTSIVVPTPRNLAKHAPRMNEKRSLCKRLSASASHHVRVETVESRVCHAMNRIPVQ